MTPPVLSVKRPAHLSSLRGAVDRILSLQLADGAIPWFEDGPWDPWNHTECAMALRAAGEDEAANAAYDCLAARQEADGSWMGEYGNALPMVERDYIAREAAPAFKDTNFSAYCAVGVLHDLLATGDLLRANRRWDMVARAMAFVLAHQSDHGDVSWAAEALGTDVDDALIAGNASIHKSLLCAEELAARLGIAVPHLTLARKRIGTALLRKPERFNRQNADGPIAAMDWYYPVLSGVLPAEEARARLSGNWIPFLDINRGCRCVDTEPWVTVAETSELSMAATSVGWRDLALRAFSRIEPYRDESGVYYMGYQTALEIMWPLEQPSWTQGAVVLAADALHSDCAHARLLIRR